MEQPLNKETVQNPLPSPWMPGSGFIVQENEEGTTKRHFQVLGCTSHHRPKMPGLWVKELWLLVLLLPRLLLPQSHSGHALMRLLLCPEKLRGMV